MFARLTRVTAFVVTLLLPVLPVQALQKVKEVALPTLPDIAMVHFRPGGDPVIFYNPILCREAGRALCEFYRYHEYGHIELRHNERDELSAQEKEGEADRWAAQHAPFASVMAAYRFFSAGGGGTPLHGASHSRAQRMLAASGSRTPLADSDKLAQPRQELLGNGRNSTLPLVFGALAL